MWNFIKQLFIWWDGQTLGTRFFTWRKGNHVGKDELGNEYYETKDSVKRWVVFNGPAEGSAVPAGWSAWLQHRSNTPPSQEKYTAKVWQAPHMINPTGTPNAYRPAGSILSRNPKAVEPDYEAWTP